jgi:hypothetical protein
MSDCKELAQTIFAGQVDWIMFGVVLWSDAVERKAVIWCEDHGDLAFYRSSDDMKTVSMDAGDWVEFDLSMQSSMRFAHNPRLIAEGVFPELPDSLESARPTRISPAAPAPEHRGSARIIPFSPSRRREVAKRQHGQASGRA